MKTPKQTNYLIFCNKAYVTRTRPICFQNWMVHADKQKGIFHLCPLEESRSLVYLQINYTQITIRIVKVVSFTGVWQAIWEFIQIITIIS